MHVFFHQRNSLTVHQRNRTAQHIVKLLLQCITVNGSRASGDFNRHYRSCADIQLLQAPCQRFHQRNLTAGRCKLHPSATDGRCKLRHIYKALPPASHNSPCRVCRPCRQWIVRADVTKRAKSLYDATSARSIATRYDHNAIASLTCA